jgi:hypothetical protein
MSRELTTALGKLAHHYTYDEVIDAAGNLLINALRQKHLRLAAAEEQVADVTLRIQRTLKDEHYQRNGTRKGVISLDPTQFPELADFSFN